MTSVPVAAPAIPATYRPVVTSLAKAGTSAKTGTVLAAVAGQPLVAIVTDYVFYRDLVPGARGPDVRAFTSAMSKAGFLPNGRDSMDEDTISAWRALVPDVVPADSVPWASLVSVSPGSTVTSVEARPGDTAIEGTVLSQVSAKSAAFQCDVPHPPRNLVPSAVELNVEGARVPIVSVTVRQRHDGEPGSVEVVVGSPTEGADASIGIVSARSNGPVLAAPLGAIKTTSDGSPTVTILEGGGNGRDVVVELGLSAGGLIAIKGDGLSPGTQVRLFDPANGAMDEAPSTRGGAPTSNRTGDEQDDR